MARITQNEIKELYDSAKTTKEQADAILEELARYAGKYDQSVNAINESLKTAQDSSTSCTELNEEASELVKELRETVKNSNQLHEEVNEFSQTIEKLQEKLSKSEERMKTLSDDAIDLKKRVENLLPGAASAGLASAFKERRESFEKPAKTWACVFIGSVVILLVVAFINPVKFQIDQVTLENFHMYILMRLPFIIPIIWLAVYASHRHNQALRLEEEYAHKEAISKSFEGYKNQILEIESDAKSSAAEHLVNRTLEALSRHPGHIYNAKREDISPMSAMKDWFSFKTAKLQENDTEKA